MWAGQKSVYNILGNLFASSAHNKTKNLNSISFLCLFNNAGIYRYFFCHASIIIYCFHFASFQRGCLMSVRLWADFECMEKPLNKFVEFRLSTFRVKCKNVETFGMELATVADLVDVYCRLFRFHHADFIERSTIWN